MLGVKMILQQSVLKCLFSYVKGITPLGIWCPKGTGVETIVYANSEHASDKVDRLSTSGTCTNVKHFLTSWFSKKHKALAFSTIKPNEYRPEKHVNKLHWIKEVLVDHVVPPDDILTLDKKSRSTYSH